MINENKFNAVAIVGGGFSGAMVAANLLRQGRPPLHVTLFDDSPEPGRGAAYGTRFSCHVLNVPAERMGAWKNEPAHFLEWLKAHESRWAPDFPDFKAEPGTFAPRQLYGRYVRDLLSTAIAGRAGGVEFEVVSDRVVECQDRATHVELRTSRGDRHAFDGVVLALGNMLPSAGSVAGAKDPRIIDDFWHRSLDDVKPDAKILIVGASLTMADVVLSLDAAGHRGTIQVLSRRGLLPLAHSFGPPSQFTLTPGTGLRRMLAEVRKRTKQESWRSVLDALRGATPALWQSLGPSDQRRFLRHVRGYWDLHRHRVAPFVDEFIRREGRLAVTAGRLVSIESKPEGLKAVYRDRRTGAEKTIEADLVFNCTGPESDLRKLRDPLLESLFAGGLCQPDALGLGLKTTNGGAVLDAHGRESDRLFTLGPLRRPALWETTAVPEIRTQAADVAAGLLARVDERASDRPLPRALPQEASL